MPPDWLPPVDELVFGDPNGLTKGEKDKNGELLRGVAPDGSLRVDMVVEMSQKYDAPFDPNKPDLGSFPMRGGATLLIAKPPIEDGKAAPGEIRYLIQKKLDGGESKLREERQRRFSLREGLLNGEDPQRFQLDFNALHGGI